MKRENLIDSILHMVVNYGESKKYESELPTKIGELCSEHFAGNITYTRKFLVASLTVEIYGNFEVYGDGSPEAENALHELDCEYTNRIDRAIQETEYK